MDSWVRICTVRVYNSVKWIQIFRTGPSTRTKVFQEVLTDLKTAPYSQDPFLRKNIVFCLVVFSWVTEHLKIFSTPELFLRHEKYFWSVQGCLWNDWQGSQEGHRIGILTGNCSPGLLISTKNIPTEKLYQDWNILSGLKNIIKFNRRNICRT